MRPSTTRSAVQLLDEVYSLTQLEALDPARILEVLGEELAAVAPDIDPQVRAALHAIEELAVKAMRIRLDHALHATPGGHAVAKPLRSTLMHTVRAYEQDLELLRARVTEAVAHQDPRNAPAVAGAVVDAARLVLEVRATLRTGVMGFVKAQADAEAAAKAEAEARSAEEAREKDIGELIEMY
jgi:hypothetical protein